MAYEASTNVVPNFISITPPPTPLAARASLLPLEHTNYTLTALALHLFSLLLLLFIRVTHSVTSFQSSFTFFIRPALTILFNIATPSPLHSLPSSVFLHNTYHHWAY